MISILEEIERRGLLNLDKEIGNEDVLDISIIEYNTLRTLFFRDYNLPPDVYAYLLSIRDALKVAGLSDWGYLEGDTIEFSWNYGNWHLEIKPSNKGSVSSRGTYHPNSGLCEGNPCKWCGSVTHD